jgi:hypothetical protein
VHLSTRKGDTREREREREREGGRNDTQHNDILHNDIQDNETQHNYIQHNDDILHNIKIKCDTQHKAECCYANYHLC